MGYGTDMSYSPTESVAAAVRAELARKRRTGVQLAELMGITQQSVSKRLCGNTPFSVTELVLVAEWLDIAPSVFLVAAELPLAVAE